MNDKSLRLRFHSEQLQLDWIGFSIQFELESDFVQKLLLYLNETFDCVIQITEINDYFQVVETYLSLNDEDFHLFVTPWKKPYWKGLLFSFRGHQARIFYKLIQEAKVNWDFFQEAKLNRIDLCYDRPFESDVSSVVSFLKDSSQQYQK